LQIIRPPDNIGGNPAKTVFVTKHDPGGILIPPHWELNHITCAQCAQTQISPARPGPNESAISANHLDPVYRRRRCGEKRRRGFTPWYRAGCQCSFINNRQFINILNPVCQVATDPTKTSPIADQYPICVSIAADRQQKCPQCQPPNRQVGLARATTHIDIWPDNAAVTGCGGRRWHSLSNNRHDPGYQVEQDNCKRQQRLTSQSRNPW
jgi:hypothetical protein